MGDHWDGLRTLLNVDHRDAGCDETWQFIDVCRLAVADTGMTGDTRLVSYAHGDDPATNPR